MHESQTKLLDSVKVLLDAIQKLPSDAEVCYASLNPCGRPPSLYIRLAAFERLFAGQPVSRDEFYFFAFHDGVRYQADHGGKSVTQYMIPATQPTGAKP